MGSIYSGIRPARPSWPSPLGPFGLRPRAGEPSSMAHGAGGAGRFRQRPVMRWAVAVARGRRWRVGLIWVVRGGRGSPERGVPWWRKPSSGERRWWSRGAAEGVGKGVEVAHGIGVEFGVLMSCSERGWSWWGHQYFGYNHSFHWDNWPYQTITSTTIKSSGKLVRMLLCL
jgi:hypothetical protein